MCRLLVAWVLLAFVMASPPIWADITCGAGENLVTGYFGTSPMIYDFPATPPYPGGDEGELVAVQLAWQAAEDEYQFQEVTTTDYRAGTQSKVRLYDGKSKSYSDTFSREAEVLDTSNFEFGQLDIAFCMPKNRDNGLIFGIYKNEDVVVALHVSPFFVERYYNVRVKIPFSGFRTTAVLNQAITEQVSQQFNQETAALIQKDIESVTNISPPRFLIESIFQREISATFKESMKDAALFYPKWGYTTVVANMLLVGNHLSVAAPHSVTRVEQNGINVLDEDNLIFLSNSWHTGPWQFEYSKLEVSVFDEGEKRPVFVLSARLDGDESVGDCGAASTIKADHYPTGLQSIIEIWKHDRRVHEGYSGSVEMDVSADHCNYNWTIRRSICFRGKFISHRDVALRASGAPLRGDHPLRTLPTRVSCDFPGYIGSFQNP